MFTRQRYVAGDLTGQSRLERGERFYLFGHLARSLSPTRRSPSSLSLSLFSSLVPLSGKDNSPAFLSPSLLSPPLQAFSLHASDHVLRQLDRYASIFCSRFYRFLSTCRYSRNLGIIYISMKLIMFLLLLASMSPS